MIRIILLFIVLLLTSCGIYSFGGSTIPKHLKSIEIPLFENKALVQGVAEDLTDKVISMAQRERMKLVASGGDATITGVVLSYTNLTDDYSGGRDDLNVKTSAVNITAKVDFIDNIKEKAIFSGTLSAKGVYDFDTEDEEIGRKRALEDLADKVLFNSLQGW